MSITLTLKELNDLIDVIEDRIIRRGKVFPFDRKLNAEVISVGSGVATIKFIGDTDNIPDVLIGDGVPSLSATDIVIVEIANNSTKSSDYRIVQKL